MKNRQLLFNVGFVFGVTSLVLARKYRLMQAETLAWQKRQRLILDVLACPTCHGSLAEVRGGLCCPGCQKVYPIVNGIPYFIERQQLTGINGRFAHLYDWFSWGYRLFSKLAFFYIGMNEEEARREILDRLDPQGGRVLEVSIGPGVNLPYLIGRPDVAEVFGLDISLGQLHRCQEYVAHRDWDVQLHLGNAEQLPYPDNTFESVFHIGGINFFNDKKKAIEEMIRVAKPGTRILIADESEKGAQAYEWAFPRFQRTVGPQREAVVAPVALIPSKMQELKLFDSWKGWMYCIEFRKP